jgi:drug/metabolite transporter (DMT)-like permease
VTAGDDIWPLSGTAWASVAILSVLTGMVAHGLLYYAQRAVPIGTISVIQTSQPSLSTFWAWLLLGEAVTLAQVPGMLLASIGVALVVWFSRGGARTPDPGDRGTMSASPIDDG